MSKTSSSAAICVDTGNSSDSSSRSIAHPPQRRIRALLRTNKINVVKYDDATEFIRKEILHCTILSSSRRRQERAGGCPAYSTTVFRRGLKWVVKVYKTYGANKEWMRRKFEREIESQILAREALRDESDQDVPQIYRIATCASEGIFAIRMAFVKRRRCDEIDRARLARLLDRLARKGIAHNDPQRRHVVVDVDNVMHLIDFGESTVHRDIRRRRAKNDRFLYDLPPSKSRHTTTLPAFIADRGFVLRDDRVSRVTF